MGPETVRELFFNLGEILAYSSTILFPFLFLFFSLLVLSLSLVVPMQGGEVVIVTVHYIQ